MKYSAVAALLAASSSTVLAAQFDVTVAFNKTKTYTPNNLSVNIGDTIKFTWAGGPHTVTQMGENNDPCLPLTGGIDSKNQTAQSTLGLKFNTAGTRMFGCTVGKHCAGGMKLTVNVLEAGAPAPVATGSTGSTDTAALPSATAPAATPASPAYPVATGTSTTPTGTTSGTVHTIIAGQGGLTFTPAALTIKQGDTVTWSFPGSTHNVKQTADKDSCTPMAGGFQSTNLMGGATFNHTFTTETGVIWYVCTFQGHCGQGMKAAITIDGTTGATTNGSTATPAAGSTSSAGTTIVSLASLAGAVAASAWMFL
ncbi:Cupredoxin [Fimicolochytrium jonesii]|uniref:Cupredoxin n=1 Tax=Fimicolochytrium jonesii TaxID=1396493 RepID=UPI0022FE2319|nr:Cupredoxin [Fimicolochytrium jonesii]KAI8817360.1 Cupredoxin [Fimicolochytrium jonesii]